MARRKHLQVTSTALSLIFFATYGVAQATSTIHQEVEKSNCSNIVALAGDANINCSSLTPAQKKALENIPAILKMALANQDYLDAILVKLDKMSKAVSQLPVTNVAPGGFAISGGTILNPQVTNNYAEKVPNILGFQIVTSSSSETELPDFKMQAQGNPTTSFKFYVDAAWDDPQFVAICDRPCHALDVREAKPSGVMITPNFRTGSVPEHPDLAIFIVDIRPFQTFRYYLFSVASEDDEPVKIVRFARFSAEHRTPQ